MGSFTWLDTQTATPHQHEVANSLEATAATEEGNLGLWKDYIRESPSRLYCERVAGKNKRHDAYNIREMQEDGTKVIILQMKRKHTTLHETRFFFDARDRHVLTIRRKTKHLFYRIGVDPNQGEKDGKEVFDMKRCGVLGDSDMTVEFVNAFEGKHPTKLVFKGDRKSRAITLADSKRRIGTFSRIDTSDQVTEHYDILVAPGVDLLLIAAVTVTFDDMFSVDSEYC